MSYIEKERNPITTYSCEESCACGDSCTCNSNTNGDNTSLYDASKYAYLDDFDSWEDEDKYALFMPMTRHVYNHSLSQIHNDGICNYDLINHTITKIHMKTGRTLKEIKYDYSHQGVPTVLLIFNPITESILPEPYGSKISQWGIHHYLI